MPNSTKEEPAWQPDPIFMSKSWVDLAENPDYYGEPKRSPEAEEDPEKREAPQDKNTSSSGCAELVHPIPEMKEEPVQTSLESEDLEKSKAHKRIDFDNTSESSDLLASPPRPVAESPMKVESPLMLCLTDDESPMKTDTPVKSESETTPVKSERKTPSKQEGSAAKALASKRLWASPRRYNPLSAALSPRVSPRRPHMPPISPANLMSPPRDGLKRKRPQDLFKQSSPASSIGSPGSDRSSVFSPRPKRRPPADLETDPEVLRRRQKQIDYGKNTEGYRCYLETVPKKCRSHRHPHTPPRELKHSRRAWDGMVRAWRQQLHHWDPPGHSSDSLDVLDCSLDTDVMSEASEHSGTSGACPSEASSEVSYPGSGGKLRTAQRPASTLSLEDFPPLV